MVQPVSFWASTVCCGCRHFWVPSTSGSVTSLGDQHHQPPTHLSQHLGQLFHLPTPIEFNSNPWSFGFQSWSQIPSPLCVCLCPWQPSPAAPLRTFWSTSVCTRPFPSYNPSMDPLANWTRPSCLPWSLEPWGVCLTQAQFFSLLPVCLWDTPRSLSPLGVLPHSPSLAFCSSSPALCFQGRRQFLRPFQPAHLCPHWRAFFFQKKKNLYIYILYIYMFIKKK